MSDEENGHEQSLLDRSEQFKEILREEHIAFAEEHKKLLAAQVVLNHQLQEMRALQKATDARRPKSRKQSDERLNALRAFVDDLIRKRPPPQ
jgi:hypothetical protein